MATSAATWNKWWTSHVEHRAGGVVELRPVADVERLRHVDLHRLDVLGIPARGEQPVAEPQQVQVLSGFLARKWSIR